ncbi:MAG: lipid A deacylase LpxR family protein, partial [Opitutales bacterium]|nr:lipid A deacylase LpxR family protein [Opitutales bacterium]
LPEMNDHHSRLSGLKAAGILLALGFAFAGDHAHAVEKGTYNLYLENDYFAGTDRYYTNGIKLGWSSVDLEEFRDTPLASPWLPIFNLLEDEHLKAYQKNLIYVIGQNIYTPQNTETSEYVPDDRPYAGWLYTGVGVVWKNQRVRNTLLFHLGMVGPASMAKETQRMIHDLKNIEHPMGWEHQLHNEIGLVVAYERMWRWPPSPVKRLGLDWELLPHAGLVLGNVHCHANAGAELRAGINLPDDFGTAAIGPTASTSTPIGGDMKTSRALLDLGFHLFARVDGRAVARNIFLDGNTFDDSHSVERKVWVSDLSIGFVVTYKNTKLAYAHVSRTREYQVQEEPQKFGTITLSWAF